MRNEFGKITVPILSTGQESTIGNWIDLSSAVFGHDSKQVEFLKSWVTEENGLDEPILADKTQMLYVLANIK